uniref:Uncharacterized protein n=1 Tax=Timema genevievae TaxID=629358 RepID=A0A7R9JVS7_TIMGE|nr:unnamed protein product [Timema genevievae]
MQVTTLFVGSSFEPCLVNISKTLKSLPPPLHMSPLNTPDQLSRLICLLTLRAHLCGGQVVPRDQRSDWSRARHVTTSPALDLPRVKPHIEKETRLPQQKKSNSKQTLLLIKQNKLERYRQEEAGSTDTASYYPFGLYDCVLDILMVLGIRKCTRICLEEE